MRLPFSLLFSSLLLYVSAQSTSAQPNSTVATSSAPSSTSPSSSPSPTPSDLTVFLVTTSYTTTSVSHSGTQDIPFTTVVPTVYNATSTLPTPTPSTSSSPSPTPIVLATEITPAFGVLGGILILTGLPSAFWGHKNRWYTVPSSYTSSRSVLVFQDFLLPHRILYPVSRLLRSHRQIWHPPSSEHTEQNATRHVCARLFRSRYNGRWLYHLLLEGHQILHWGLGRFRLWFVDTVLQRWWPHPISWTTLDIVYWYDLVAFCVPDLTLFPACGVVAFVLCTIPKLHWHMLLLATAFVGSSAFMLGVDCYTTAGLKEVRNSAVVLLGYLNILHPYSSMSGTWDSEIYFPSILATTSRSLSRRPWRLNLA